MRRLVIRQIQPATLSAEQAERVVASYAEAKILGSDGRTMLVEFDPCTLDPPALDSLRERLPGWLVTEQGAPVPVPDYCVHVRQERP